MRCQYCGRIIPDDSAFCPECGQRQEELSFHAESSFDSTQESKPEVCPVCGTVMEEGTLFCPECGTPYARSEQQSGTRFEDTEEMPYISSPEDSEELLKVRDEEEFEEFGSQRDGRVTWAIKEMCRICGSLWMSLMGRKRAKRRL